MMATLELDDLVDELPLVVEGQLEVRKGDDFLSLQQAKMDELQSIQDSIFTETSKNILDSSYYNRIDAAAEEPPEDWVQTLGQERAWERFRMAKYNLMTAKEAPIGVTNAVKVYAALVKAKATERGGPVRLNIEKVVIYESPPPVFPRVELEEGQ